MARNLFRGAPELSRLVMECPETMIDEFLRHPQFSEFLPALMAESDPNADAASDDGPVMRIKTLKDDRIKLFETEAMRITAMAEREPDIMLRKLSKHRRFGDLSEMRQVQDALQRSLWAFCNAVPLFEAAERAMQVKVYRDHGRVYQSWSIDASIPIGTEDIDDVKLATEIADRLQHDEGCHVDAIELPIGDGVAPEILVAVTFFGPYSSQKTVRPNKKTELVYFRPPDELLLVYSQRRQLIEVCARDATERREVANIFAGETLRHDLSNKPLTQKNFDLSRFRRSLKLPIPDQEAHRVRSASITEVQIALGDWTKKVALTVAPDKDIDTTAREVFSKVIPGTGGGYITRVGFHIEYSGPKGKSGSLKFQVFGRNKSNIQSERDPMKRALGYDLLEAWGVLERISGLSPHARLERLPQLMALYDLTETVVTGRLLAEIGVDAADLTSHGFLVSKGWSDVILFEDDQLGEIPHYVEAGRTDGQVTLSLEPGGSGHRMASEDITKYEVRFDYVRDALRQTISALGLKGRVRELDEHLHQLGTTSIGHADVPVFLMRGMSNDKLLERTERLLRGESNNARGIVFTPQSARFPYSGCNVVLGLPDYLDTDDRHLDVDSIRIAYEASIDAALRGSAVHFRRQGDGAAQVTVPGQQPRIVIGAKKVLLFERLFKAHQSREFGVKLAELKAYAGFKQLPQMIGDEWPELENRYLYSPKRGFWALCEEPISV